MSDLAIPKGLSTAGKLAAELILEVLKERDIEHTGGCKAFYSPKEWKARGEEFAQNAVLVVVYDGGSVGRCFEYGKEDYKAIEAMDARLGEHDLRAECGTHWYAGIYSNVKLS
jgi:hypothetical protein